MPAESVSSMSSEIAGEAIVVDREKSGTDRNKIAIWILVGGFIVLTSALAWAGLPLKTLIPGM
jgi:hypothetical protein